MTSLFALSILAAGLLAGGLGVSLRRAGLREAAFRRGLLADCAGLLEGPRLVLDEAGYGVLRGRFQGVDVALRPFADTLSFRRLPQLWLAVTVRIETGEATLDALRRPNGADAFPSNGRALPLPPDWPSDTRVRGSVDAFPMLVRAAPTLAPILADDETKHVLVAPRGVRLVRRIAEGDRRAFLIFRESRFADARVTPADAEAALINAIAIARAAKLEAETHAKAA